jgi:imidazolonepropionase-like amidohydrolase
VLTSLDPFVDPRFTPAEFREQVRQHRARGADLIKLFASGGLGETTEPQTLSDEQLVAICGEAKSIGLRSVVHAMTGPSVRAATLAGCTEIEHGLQATDADLQLVASRHAVFGPQVCLVFRNYLERRGAFGRSGFPPESFRVLADALPQARDLFRRALATPGLDIVLSSDAVAGAHGRNAEELICRVAEAGQRPTDAIVSATSRAARALGLGDRIGAVTPGLEADIIAVEGDPLRDITALRRPVFVMRAGRIYRSP